MYRFSLPALAVAALLLVTACGTHKSGSTESSYRDDKKVEKIDGKTVAGILREAERWKGTPYRYGGKTRKGTDCSGMVMSIYLDVAGIKLPRSAAEQQDFCRKIDRKKLQPADLVFFTTSKKRGRVNHVGIYTGDGRFIHASSSRGVISSRLDEDYYDRHYHSSGRIDKLPGRGRHIEEIPDATPSVVPDAVPAGRFHDVPSISLEDLLKMQTSHPVDTTSVVVPADSLSQRADSIREEVLRAF